MRLLEKTKRRKSLYEVLKAIIRLKIKEFTESKYDDNDYDRDGECNQLDTYLMKANTHFTKNKSYGKRSDSPVALRPRVRLDNAISKIGDFDTNKAEIYETFIDDILCEINGYHINGLREQLLNKVKNDHYWTE